MSKSVVTADVSGQMIFLGTGTSVGVPVIGCGCPVCTSDDRHNNRLRCSLVLGLPEGTLLVDTTPDLRTQLLREQIGLVHATLYTHDHADHVFGLDDLRLFPYYLGHPMPVYCEQQVEARIRKSFDYAFAHEGKHYAGGVPQIEFHPITTEPFEVLGARVTPMRLEHGRFRVLGFRFGNIAYCTDTNLIPAESWPLLAGLDVLVLDALRQKSASDALQPGRSGGHGRASGSQADVLHAHVARPGARGDQRPVARGHATGLRRPAAAALLTAVWGAQKKAQGDAPGLVLNRVPTRRSSA